MRYLLFIAESYLSGYINHSSWSMLLWVVIFLFLVCIGLIIYLLRKKKEWLAAEKRLNELNKNVPGKESRSECEEHEVEVLEQLSEEAKGLGEEREKAFYTSDIYMLFYNYAPNTISKKDILALIKAIDNTFPDFNKHLLQVFPGIDYQTKLTLYMTKANLNPKTIGICIAGYEQYASTKRRRLCNLILGEGKPLDVFDSYIRSL